MESELIRTLASIVLQSAPLIIAVCGETITERVGVVNSQPELFEAAGLPAQPTPTMTERTRARAMKLLQRAERLGIVELVQAKSTP